MSERFNVKEMMTESGSHKDRLASLAEAEAIMSDDFLGPAAIESVFKAKLKEAPPVPFSIQELERAKELGDQLILFVGTLPNYEGLTILEMGNIVEGSSRAGDHLFDNAKLADVNGGSPSFLDDVCRFGWRLVSREVVEGTYGKNYVAQTELLITYLQERVFASTPLPEEYRVAIEEFRAQKDNFPKSSFPSTLQFRKMIQDLAIDKLTRETAPEAVYRLILNDRVYNRKLLPSGKTWTKTFFSDNNNQLIYVGRFRTEGLVIKGSPPHVSEPWTGACLSRPGFFKPADRIEESASPLPSTRNF